MDAERAVELVSCAGDSPVFENPSDYGLIYDDVTFTADDGVPLSGWLIPGARSEVIIQTHFGGICSRAGYTPDGRGDRPPWPQPIHFLRHIEALVAEGYSVLAYDMRNHGDSGPDPAGKLTSGVREASDVLAAVRFVTGRPEYAHAPIGLLSLCMGANATTYAFGMTPGLTTVANIRALIAIQPLLTVDQLRAMRVPDAIIEPANELNQRQGGADLRASFLPAVARIRVPTMLVQNTNDPMLNRRSIDAFYDLLDVEKEMTWVDLESARLAAYDYFANDPTGMIRFFDAHVRSR
ncbi:alpha/beta fold hydrolase [Mycolicibacterium sp.]|uniref:alpha/beta hydrolase family protein n=1 Tax=Mycolicibacterium sp. TaxID=2320850 RepID=UPI001A29A83B|nr:alpha/beta fold hydrolase [Mycolicibacterium sp.]MBJ7336763.1 alpha/beta fold hydrolase [Mycolicibacterium sp.]